MSKLICDFEEFNSKKSNISNLIETYNTIVSRIVSKSQVVHLVWQSDAQKVFLKKLMERKTELDKLSGDFEEVNNFLNEVVNTYQNIEGKYS